MIKIIYLKVIVIILAIFGLHDLVILGEVINKPLWVDYSLKLALLFLCLLICIRYLDQYLYESEKRRRIKWMHSLTKWIKVKPLLPEKS